MTDKAFLLGRMGVKRSRDFILTLEDDDLVSHSESESEYREDGGKKKKIKDDLNADFEFEGYGVQDGVEETEADGWGFGGIKGVKGISAVDLDGIIARRKAKRDRKDARNHEVEVDSQKEDSEYESEGSEEFRGFDDEEEAGITLPYLD